MSSIISTRPRGGTACQDPAQSNGGYPRDPRRPCRKYVTLPGGRRLWRRLVAVFCCVNLLGIVLLVVGCVCLDAARSSDADGSQTVAMVLSVTSIVIGALMLCTSLVLGKLFISMKWRTEEEVANTSAQVRFTPTQSTDGEPGLAMQVCQPPPYDAGPGAETGTATVFSISGNMASGVHDTSQPSSPVNHDQLHRLPATTSPPSYYSVPNGCNSLVVLRVAAEERALEPPAYCEVPQTSDSTCFEDAGQHRGILPPSYNAIELDSSSGATPDFGASRGIEPPCYNSPSDRAVLDDAVIPAVSRVVAADVQSTPTYRTTREEHIVVEPHSLRIGE